MVLDLINNVALLLAICWLQSLVSNSLPKESVKAQVCSGFVFGAATVIVMMTSILIEPGLWLWTDSGMVVVSVSTLLYGPVAGGMSLAAGVVYKLWIGGVASSGAVINLLISFSAGWMLRIAIRKQPFRLTWFHFLLFGFFVHLIGTWQLYHFHMPVDAGAATSFYLTLLAIMGPATAILGLQLLYIERKAALEREIKESEKRLGLIAQSIPDQLVLASKDGVLTDIFTPGILAATIQQRADKHLASIDPQAFERHYAYLISKALSSGESVTDTYSCHRKYLLDDTPVELEHHFESSSRPVEGYEDSEVVILTRDITRRVNAEREVAFLAYYDPLTNLPNAYKAMDTLRDHVVKFGELGKEFFITMLHLDNFYLFNDSLGKEAGDAVLKEVGEKLRDSLGDGHLLFRFSGVEFLILTPDSGRPEDVIRLFRKLRLDISVPVDGEKIEFNLAVSGGICRFPHDARDHQELVRKASLALDAAVNTSSKVRFYHSMLDQELNSRLTSRRDLLNLVKEDRLTLSYEPVFSSGDKSIIGVEAILGCDDPKYSHESSESLMEAAAKSGLTHSMVAWVLEKACFATKELERTSGFSGNLFVKMSPIELCYPEFPFLIQSVLSRAQLSPDRLYIDITESMSDKPIVGIRRAIAEVARMGVRLRVDIFSSSYGALASLENTHGAILKISGELAVRSSLEDVDHKTLSSLLALAKALNVATLVEGVADKFTAKLITSVGFDAVQGSYYGAPVTFDEIKKMLKAATPDHS